MGVLGHTTERILGVFFSVLLVCLSAADTITDVLLLVEFYEQGWTGSAMAVLSVLLLSTIVSACLLVHVVMVPGWLVEWPVWIVDRNRIAKFFIALPIAPFAPCCVGAIALYKGDASPYWMLSHHTGLEWAQAFVQLLIIDKMGTPMSHLQVISVSVTLVVAVAMRAFDLIEANALTFKTRLLQGAVWAFPIINQLYTLSVLKNATIVPFVASFQVGSNRSLAVLSRLVLQKSEPEPDSMASAKVLYKFLENAKGDEAEEHRRLVYLTNTVNVTKNSLLGLGALRANMLLFLPLRHIELLSKVEREARNQLQRPIPAPHLPTADQLLLPKSSLRLAPHFDDLKQSDEHPFGYATTDLDADLVEFTKINSCVETVLQRLDVDERQQASELLSFIVGALREKETHRTLQWYRNIRDAARCRVDEHGNALTCDASVYVRQRLVAYLLDPVRLCPLMRDCRFLGLRLYLSRNEVAMGKRIGDLIHVCFHVAVAVMQYTFMVLDPSNVNVFQWLCTGAMSIALLTMLMTSLSLPAYFRQASIVRGLQVLLNAGRILPMEVRTAEAIVNKYREAAVLDVVAACVVRASPSSRSRSGQYVLTQQMAADVGQYLEEDDVPMNALTSEERVAIRRDGEQLLHCSTVTVPLR